MLEEIGRAFAGLWGSAIERIPSVLAGLAVLLLFWAGSRLAVLVVRRLAVRTHLPGNLVALLVRIGSFLRSCSAHSSRRW